MLFLPKEFTDRRIDSVLAQDDAQHAKAPLSGRRLATPPKVSEKCSLFSQRCDKYDETQDVAVDVDQINA
jgi:hypothetical protein